MTERDDFRNANMLKAIENFEMFWPKQSFGITGQGRHILTGEIYTPLNELRLRFGFAPTTEMEIRERKASLLHANQEPKPQLRIIK